MHRICKYYLLLYMLLIVSCSAYVGITLILHIIACTLRTMDKLIIFSLFSFWICVKKYATRVNLVVSEIRHHKNIKFLRDNCSGMFKRYHYWLINLSPITVLWNCFSIISINKLIKTYHKFVAFIVVTTHAKN